MVRTGGGTGRPCSAARRGTTGRGWLGRMVATSDVSSAIFGWTRSGSAIRGCWLSAMLGRRGSTRGRASANRRPDSADTAVRPRSPPVAASGSVWPPGSITPRVKKSSERSGSVRWRDATVSSGDEFAGSIDSRWCWWWRDGDGATASPRRSAGRDMDGCSRRTEPLSGDWSRCHPSRRSSWEGTGPGIGAGRGVRICSDGKGPSWVPSLAADHGRSAMRRLGSRSAGAASRLAAMRGAGRLTRSS